MSYATSRPVINVSLAPKDLAEVAMAARCAGSREPTIPRRSANGLLDPKNEITIAAATTSRRIKVVARKNLPGTVRVLRARRRERRRARLVRIWLLDRRRVRNHGRSLTTATTATMVGFMRSFRKTTRRALSFEDELGYTACAHGSLKSVITVGPVAENESGVTCAHLREPYPRESFGSLGLVVVLHSNQEPLRSAGGEVVNGVADQNPAVIKNRHGIAGLLENAKLLAREEFVAPRGRSRRIWPMASMPNGSSQTSGSSSTKGFGSCTRAAASCTRCWLPWESVSTLFVARSAISRRLSHEAVAGEAFEALMPCSRSRYSTCSAMSMFG